MQMNVLFLYLKVDNYKVPEPQPNDYILMLKYIKYFKNLGFGFPEDCQIHPFWCFAEAPPVYVWFKLIVIYSEQCDTVSPFSVLVLQMSSITAKCWY